MSATECSAWRAEAPREPGPQEAHGIHHSACSRLRVRRLGAADRESAARLAHAAFRGNSFYHAAMDFDERAFAVYWHAFFTLALGDPGARAFGAELDGSLAGVLVVCTDGFPSAPRAARFLGTLLRRTGPRATLRYLRFVFGFERVMHRPSEERRVEARGLWLMADPGAAARIGTALLREAMEVMAGEGRPLYTGFVDAGDQRLLAFYRRQGFVPVRCLPFADGWAAVVERRGLEQAAGARAVKAAPVAPGPAAAPRAGEVRPC
jgi:hypothetical protein